MLLACLPLASLALAHSPDVKTLLPPSRQQASPHFTWAPDQIAPSVYAARRARLREMLTGNGVFVLFTNPLYARNNDVDFPFRADSNMLYLTGLREPDAALIMAPSGISVNGKIVKEVLFVNPRSPGAEAWTGYRLGPDRAKAALAMEEVLPNSSFADVISKLKPPFDEVRLVSPAYEPGAKDALKVMQTSFEDWKQQMGSGLKADRRMGATLGAMRFVKDAEEIGLLRKACSISAMAHREAIRSCEPGMREWELGSLVEYVFKRNGCWFPGYGSIVGCGPNSCILHYDQNEKPMQAGEIVCMDVGGEYAGYTADITRSFPVNGRFSPEQKAIYNLVLAAQQAGIDACKPGESFGAAHQAASKVLAEGMQKLGIIKGANELRTYFMHGTSHSLGLDVHDAMGGDSTLRKGVVLTVEPGIYIKEGSPCDKKWWNIGVRIEDDILITEKGNENLSAAVPRKAEEIEALMREKGLGNFDWKGR